MHNTMTSTNTFVFRPSNTRFMDFQQGPSRPSMMWNNQLDAVLPKRQKPMPDEDGFVQPKHRSKARGPVSANQEMASQKSNKFKVLDNKHENKEPQEEGIPAYNGPVKTIGAWARPLSAKKEAAPAKKPTTKQATKSNRWGDDDDEEWNPDLENDPFFKK